MDRKAQLRQHRGMPCHHPDHPPLPAFEWLGRCEYLPIWQRMQDRAGALAVMQQTEVVWACEHAPVYTTGRRGIDNRRQARLPAPLQTTDRGGETTFHGPGQVMLYPVLSLRGRGIGVRDYVGMLEQSCIDLLAAYDIAAVRREGVPGVWVGAAKIAAIGLRISRGVAWHGMALNVRVEPDWFAAIDACGAGFGITSMDALVHPPALDDVAHAWYAELCALLGAT